MMQTQNIILWRRFFSGLAYTAMQSVFFIYLQYYKGFETAQISTAFSLLVFTSQAFALFAGALGDRFGRARMMTIGCMLDALAYLLLLLTSGYPFLLLATTFFGLGSTLFSTNARAFLLSDATESYSVKVQAQGKFLKVASLASMVAPLISIPFVTYHKAGWLIWLSTSIEIVMLLFMLKAMPPHDPKNTQARLNWRALKSTLSKRFVFAHLLLFIPLGMSTAFYVIFPYIFTNLLDQKEMISIAFFLNNLIAVLLQSRFSRHLNLGISKLVFIAPLLIIGLFLPWFYALQMLSTVTAFAYLLVFALISLFANTALANVLVKLDKGENQGLMFGLSKMILAVTTAILMNLLPYFFLI